VRWKLRRKIVSEITQTSIAGRSFHTFLKVIIYYRSISVFFKFNLITLSNFTLHFGLKYEIIYQLDAIEYSDTSANEDNSFRNHIR